jgi:uncharacterized protein (DUF1501 family)
MKSAFCDGITRRAALRVGVLGGLGMGLGRYLALANENRDRRPTADACIFIHLQGGPSHLDTLDMKPDAPAEERGEFSSIATRTAGYRVCEHLPKFAQSVNEFCIVRGMSHSAGAHPQADEYIFTGNRPSAAVKYPGLGSVLAKERPSRPDLPSFVAVPTSEMGPGFLGVAYSSFKTTNVPRRGQPFEVRGLSLANGLTLERVRDRARLLGDLDTKFRALEKNSSLLEGMDRFGRVAHEMILSAHARDAFDVSKETERLAHSFDNNEFGQSLLLAARLVEFGVRFVTVQNGAWDTHRDNFKNLKNQLLPPFDSAITALVEALKQKGLLQRTLVVCLGEFGRTPNINPLSGRDHWPRSGWALFAGGGVRVNQMIGGTDRKGHGPDDGTKIAPDDLAASIYTALGVDPHKEYFTNTGRPATLVQHGAVVPGLFA